MRYEGNLAIRRGREVTGVEFSTEKSKSSSKKSKRRQKKSGAMPRVVQRLFEMCNQVFSNYGTVPSPEDVDRLRSILDNMSPRDVGLTENMPYFGEIESEGAPPVTYLPLYECDKFTICIFCLPPSGVIPLHNHPGMTVFSKLLFGTMHIKSYDWIDVPQNTNNAINPSNLQTPGVRLAKLKANGAFTAPCETSVLYPADGGNMHCFTALTACAVLDVLGPPYSDPEGRHCTYYNEFPYASFSGDADMVPREGEGYAWLEEGEKPNDFFVVGAQYRGPRIVER